MQKAVILPRIPEPLDEKRKWKRELRMWPRLSVRGLFNRGHWFIGLWWNDDRLKKILVSQGVTYPLLEEAWKHVKRQAKLWVEGVLSWEALQNYFEGWINACMR